MVQESIFSEKERETLKDGFTEGELSGKKNEESPYDSVETDWSNKNLQEKGDEKVGTSKRRKMIHSSFLQLKKKLNITNFMRKTQIDSLLKKCKSKAFKTIHESIKKCLNFKLQRLPQNFITNIKIDFNKFYLDQSIFYIYQKNGIFSSFEDIKIYVLPEKKEVLETFLSLKLNEVIEYYVNSKKYINDYLHIVKREGEKFAQLFDFVSKNFITYYINNKGNKPKKFNKTKRIRPNDINKESNVFKIEKSLRNKKRI